MSRGDVGAAAVEMLEAEAAATARGPLTDHWPDLDLRTAYAIQHEALRRRIMRGEKLIGVKLGLTSRAKQQRMGISSPSVAWLTDAMVHPTGDPLPRARFIHPRAEPEIAFVLGRPLRGPGVTAATALNAVDAVFGAIEIIDSRFADFRFTLPDAVADNNSSGVFATGGVARRTDQVDLAMEAVLLEVDGQIVDTATGAAVQGHPAEALALAANALAERGLGLEPGWIILTGGMTDAVPVTAGARVAAHFTSLGSVTIAGG